MAINFIYSIGALADIISKPAIAQYAIRHEQFSVLFFPWNCFLIGQAPCGLDVKRCLESHFRVSRTPDKD